jgi:hypothetical protein
MRFTSRRFTRQAREFVIEGLNCGVMPRPIRNPASGTRRSDVVEVYRRRAALGDKALAGGGGIKSKACIALGWWVAAEVRTGLGLLSQPLSDMSITNSNNHQDRAA